MGKRENLWKRYRRAKTKEDKSEILAEINNIQPVIKELRKYDKYCKDIFERSETMQNNLNNFDKNMQKENESEVKNVREELIRSLKILNYFIVEISKKIM